VVSPHYDDAPLSLGQSLLDGDLAAATVTVGIVFGRSNWTRYFHPTERRWPIASAIRLFEECVNAWRFRYRIRVGHLRECILRTGETDPSVYLDPSHDVTDDPLVAEVADLVAAWAGRADLTLVPLGLGGHVDHRIVAQAGRGLAARGHPVAFYEDRPYACWLSDADLIAAARTVVPDGHPVAVSGPITLAKRDRLWYPSQIDDYFSEAMDLDEQGGRRERTWS